MKQFMYRCFMPSFSCANQDLKVWKSVGKANKLIWHVLPTTSTQVTCKSNSRSKLFCEENCMTTSEEAKN